MPGKSNRKIMRHGRALVVSIPKSYRDYYGLKPGDTVTVLFDSILLVIPEALEEKIRERWSLIDQLLTGGI